MGLYDDLRCEWPVPGIEDFKPFDAQTKALICYCEQYRIDADGQLLLQRWNHRPFTAEEVAGMDEHQRFLIRDGKRIDPYWEPYRFTGSLELDYADDIEVILWLVDGRVKDAVVVKEDDI